MNNDIWIDSESLEWPLTELQVREAWFEDTNMLLPAQLPDVVGRFARVQGSSTPVVNNITQKVEQGAPALVNGVWAVQWVITQRDPEDEAQCREQVIQDAEVRIKAERDRRWNGGVQVNGVWFLSSTDEVAKYTALLAIGSAMNAPDDYVLRAAWRSMADGVTADMTPALLRSILQAGLAQLAAIDDVSQAHLAAMKAAERPDLYDYSGGWPQTFDEAPA
jgi:hypothetical protein